MSIFKKIKIVQIIPETKDAKTFVLEAKEPIPYQAGQFLSFVFQKPGGEERRSYSLSSSPDLGEPLAITVKRMANGEYSRKLIDKAREGDEFITIGASGFFTLPEKREHIKQVFLLAAGSGITPIFSLLKSMLHTCPQWQVVLLYSNRTEREIIFRRELDQLRREYPDRFKLEYLLSASLNLARARMSKWLLSILMEEYRMTSWQDTLFYLCGPFDYMRMATIQLLNEGVPPGNIHKENFYIFKPEIKSRPPDEDSHSAEIFFNGHTYHVQTQYPETILSAAKKQGISLPYSCEAGKCGTCAALCLEGRVWMSYNEVLMDNELDKGMVLTCVGYPVGGDVKLQF